mmetsp:Transcript_76358/g.196628  ORF Transcript_76358/g.196628 Transcript_76358/m.196628 type:complete len:439 (-) Transcript_76358:45-1361(-)
MPGRRRGGGRRLGRHRGDRGAPLRLLRLPRRHRARVAVGLVAQQASELDERDRLAILAHAIEHAVVGDVGRCHALRQRPFLGVPEAAKVAVVQRLVHIEALPRVEGARALKEVCGLLPDLRGYDRRQAASALRAAAVGAVGAGAGRTRARPLQEGHGLGRDPVGLLLGGHARDLNDALELVVAILPREEGLAAPHLIQDAPDGPDVDGRAVLGSVQQHLWRTVPPRDDILREVLVRRVRGLARLTVHRDATAEAEVADLHLAILETDEDVGGLQVAVDHVAAVQGQEAEHHLGAEGAGLAGADADSLCLEQVLQVAVHQLDREIQVTAAGLERQSLVQPQNVRVPEVAHEPDLAQRPAEHKEVVPDVFDALHGDIALPSCVVEGGNNAVAATAQHLQELVALRDIEARGARRRAADGVCPLHRATNQKEVRWSGERGR